MNMKKVIIFLFVLSLLFLNNSKEKVIVPKESIRYRILANSNKEEEQKIKWDINNEIIPVLNYIMQAKDINHARQNINLKLKQIENIIEKYNINYKISFGQNYFPKKEYNGVTYNEGDYESLVITLGEGKGENWWCVLFPPLCLLEANKEAFDDVEYQSYFYSIIKNY